MLDICDVLYSEPVLVIIGLETNLENMAYLYLLPIKNEKNQRMLYDGSNSPPHLHLYTA